MKTKAFGIISTIAMSMVVAVGATVGFEYNQKAPTEGHDVREVKAATPTWTDTVLQFALASPSIANYNDYQGLKNLYANSSGAWIHFWSSSGSGTVWEISIGGTVGGDWGGTTAAGLSYDSSTLIYSSKVPTGIDRAILSITSGSAKNQTVNIDISQPRAKDTIIARYTITTWNTSVNLLEGYFDAYALYPQSPSTARMWVDRGTHYSDNLTFILNIYNSSPTGYGHQYAPAGYANIGTDASPRWVVYYDVFIDDLKYCATVQLDIHNRNGTFSYNASVKNLKTGGDKNWPAFDANYRPDKILFVQSDGTDMNFDDAIYNDSAISAENLQPVLDGYYTCLANDYNGYKAIDRIITSWFHPDATGNWAGIAAGKGLSDIEYKDYVNGDTQYSGGKTREITLYEKVTYMQHMNSLSNSAGQAGYLAADANGKNYVVPLIIGIVFTSLFVGFVIAHKKHRAHLGAK